MESYLIRIYRKAEDDPNMVVGIVREIGTEDKKTFNTLNELCSILNPVEKEPAKKKSRSAKRNSNGNGS